MWILGTFTLTANIGALYYRYRNKQENKVQVVLISNLSISDMIMGIYMVIVASADLRIYIIKTISPPNCGDTV